MKIGRAGGFKSKPEQNEEGHKNRLQKLSSEEKSWDHREDPSQNAKTKKRLKNSFDPGKRGDMLRGVRRGGVRGVKTGGNRTVHFAIGIAGSSA